MQPTLPRWFAACALLAAFSFVPPAFGIATTPTITPSVTPSLPPTVSISPTLSLTPSPLPCTEFPGVISPTNNATSVGIAPTLRWTWCGPATVKFGTSYPLTTIGCVVLDGLNSCSPGTLAPCTKYYWQVIGDTSDGSGRFVGPIWSFTTGAGGGPTATPSPVPTCVPISTPGLVATIVNPEPSSGDLFGRHVWGIGGNLLISAPGDDHGAGGAGSAYLFRSSDQALLLTLRNPAPGINDSFGWGLQSVGLNLVVSAYQDDAGGTDSGSVYLFDGDPGSPTFGNLLKTFTDPSPEAGGLFGSQLAVDGTTLVVGASAKTVGAFAGAGMVHLYDADAASPTFGNLLLTINNPSPAAGEAFGQLAAGSGKAIIGAWGADTAGADAGIAYIYDIAPASPTLGQLLKTIVPPGGAADEWFGRSCNYDNGYFYVRATRGLVNGTNNGQVFGIEASGPELGTIRLGIANPIPGADERFGSHATGASPFLLVGAALDDVCSVTDVGSAYLFDSNPGSPDYGALVAVIDNPGPAASETFGIATGVAGLYAIAAPNDDTSGTDTGLVYLFQPPAPPTPTPSATPSLTPTESLTPSISPTVSETPTVSPSPSVSASATPTPTPVSPNDDDVPTWRTDGGGSADAWSYTRAFQITSAIRANLSGNNVSMTLPMNFTDSFSKRVGAITTVNTGAAGFAAARGYERFRTAGTLSLTGQANMSGVPLSTVTVSLNGFTGESSTAFPGGGTSYDWVGVGDLAQIRERFGVVNASGNVRVQCGGIACGFICPMLAPITCANNPATLNLDFALDHGPTGPNPTRVGPVLIDKTSGVAPTAGATGGATVTSAITAREQSWTLTCVTDPSTSANNSTWSVAGSLSGASGTLTAGTPFIVANEVTITVTDSGTAAWDSGAAPNDRMRFSVTRDPFTPWDFNGGGLELADFPFGANAEDHIQGASRRIIGALSLDAPGTALDVIEPLDVDRVAKYNLTLASGVGAAASTPRVLTGWVAGNADNIQYRPDRRDFSAWTLGGATPLIQRYDKTLTLATFTTTNSSFAAAPGANTLAVMSISPAAIRPGQPFTVSGTATAGTTLTGIVLLPGGGGSTAGAAISGGNWSINLTAPSTDDDSPMPDNAGNGTTRDFGSFGIEFISDGASPNNRRVATLRLRGRPYVGGVAFASDPANLSVFENVAGGRVTEPIACLDFAGKPMASSWDIDVTGFSTFFAGDTAFAPGDYTAPAFTTFRIEAGQKYNWPPLGIYGHPSQISGTPAAVVIQTDSISLINDAVGGTCDPTEFFTGKFTGKSASENDVDLYATLRGTVEIKDDPDPVCSVTPTFAFSFTPTPTLGISVTPTSSVTLSPTPSVTLSPTLAGSIAPSLSPSVSLTASPTPSVSPTPSASPTMSASPSATPPPTASPTPTATESPSPTSADSETPSPTLTPSLTPSPSPSATSTPSISPTPPAAEAAMFVSDSLPTFLDPDLPPAAGAITVKNVGSGAWSGPDFKIKLSYDCSFSPWITLNGFAVPDGTTVLPGESIQLSGTISVVNIGGTFDCDVTFEMLGTAGAVISVDPLVKTIQIRHDDPEATTTPTISPTQSPSTSLTPTPSTIATGSPTPSITPTPSCGAFYGEPGAELTPPPSATLAITLTPPSAPYIAVGAGGSIQAALQRAAPGTRIILTASSYTEAAVVTGKSDLTIESVSGAAAWSGGMESLGLPDPYVGFSRPLTPLKLVGCQNIVIRGVRFMPQNAPSWSYADDWGYDGIGGADGLELDNSTAYLVATEAHGSDGGHSMRIASVPPCMDFALGGMGGDGVSVSNGGMAFAGLDCLFSSGAGGTSNGVWYGMGGGESGEPILGSYAWAEIDLPPQPTPTVTATPTATTAPPTATETPSLTPSATPTVSPTSDGGTITQTASLTPTVSITPTATPTASLTPSATPTLAGPMIVAQPRSLVVNAGQSAAFSVDAIGDAPLAYAWKKGAGPAPGIANAAEYSIASATTADAGSYLCSVSNIGGSVDSDAATLTVIEPPAANSADYVSNSAPGGIEPGEIVYIGIEMRNTSALTWSGAQGHALAVIDDPDGLFQGATRLYPASTPWTVAPGNGIARFVAAIRAPIALGAHAAQVRMVEEGVEFFGETGTITIESIEPPNRATDWETYE